MLGDLWITRAAKRVEAARVEQADVEHGGGAGIAEGRQPKGEQRAELVRWGLRAEAGGAPLARAPRPRRCCASS